MGYISFSVWHPCVFVTYVTASSHVLIYMYIYKGKAILLKAWTGPYGSRRLRLPDFKTIGT